MWIILWQYFKHSLPYPAMSCGYELSSPAMLLNKMSWREWNAHGQPWAVTNFLMVLYTTMKTLALAHSVGPDTGMSCGRKTLADGLFNVIDVQGLILFQDATSPLFSLYSRQISSTMFEPCQKCRCTYSTVLHNVSFVSSTTFMTEIFFYKVHILQSCLWPWLRWALRRFLSHVSHWAVHKCRESKCWASHQKQVKIAFQSQSAHF